MSYSQKFLASAAALSFFVGASPALAQSAPQAEDAKLEEIIVTGRAGASERRRVEASYAVTTLSAEALRLQREGDARAR